MIRDSFLLTIPIYRYNEHRSESRPHDKWGSTHSRPWNLREALSWKKFPRFSLKIRWETTPSPSPPPLDVPLTTDRFVKKVLGVINKCKTSFIDRQCLTMPDMPWAGLERYQCGSLLTSASPHRLPSFSTNGSSSTCSWWSPTTF